MVRAKNYGRMGNALYQNAAAIGYAIKHNIGFSVPYSTTSHKWNPLYVQHLVNPNWQEGREDVVIREGQHEFSELPFEEDWRGSQIVLDGYWQSYKYWNHCEKDVLDLFNFKWQHNEGFVSVHIRRTDYLELVSKHPPVPKEWVLEAMSMFPGKKFIFYSDDIGYCRDEYSYRSDCYFSNGASEIEDIEGISSCEAHICSASTFSVWGYHLNRYEGKKAIFPQQWFVPGYSNLITTDIIPPECIKL